MSFVECLVFNETVASGIEGAAMGLLDPTVCDEAKLLIEQGRIGDAARLLLKTPEPRHKSVQRGLADVAARRNARAAREANEQHWELARVSIELAAQCAELPDDGRVLRERDCSGAPTPASPTKFPCATTR